MDERRGMTRRRAWLVGSVIRRGLCLLSIAAACAAGWAADTDLHRYWDSRCKDCHGDAGAFARRTLRLLDGRLVGAHHEQDLDLFLHHHYLAEELVEPVKRMLAAQVSTPPVFARQCSGCHGNAAEFARKSLSLRGDVLVGRRSQRPVAQYLQSHGGLPPDQIPIVVESLRRVLREVGAARDGG